jgi:branched-chain amino acid transport system permease protein
MNLVESYRDDLKLIERPWTWAWIAMVIIVLFLVPYFGSEYLVYVGTLVFIVSVGVIGQNILIGYTGQISLGQAGFLAIGAFTFGHLSRLGLPISLGLLVAGCITATFGVLIGFPSLRLKGPYLAIVTLGFGIAVYQIFSGFEILSGGRMGLVIPKFPAIFGFSREVSIYYFSLLLAMVFTLAAYNIISSYVGRAFVAIRDNDIAAEVVGVNLTEYKLLSFGISSFYTGIHGAMLGLFLGYVEPQMFSFLETLNIFVAVVIGGLASVEGAIFGAAFIILVPQFLSNYRELVPAVFGATVVFIMIFEPLGLAGRWFKFRLYYRNWPFR